MEKHCFKSMNITNPEIPQKEKEAIKKALEISGKPIPKNTIKRIINWIKNLLTIICFIGLFFIENPIIKAFFVIYIAFRYISYALFSRLYIFNHQRVLFVINTLLKNKNVDLFN